jgi:hypothetical protein
MNMGDASTKTGMWRRWPATTITASLSLSALAALVGTTMLEERDEEASASNTAADGSRSLLPAAEMKLDAPPPPETPEEVDVVDRGADGRPYRVEEGKMGKPTSKAKAGLYAMKGPAGAPAMARSAGVLGTLSAPAEVPAGAFAVGADDSDVWGGLSGSEVGEAFGAGGLGLIGTGHGGGGEGSGMTLGGRGKSSGYGRGAGSFGGKTRRGPDYDRSIQARQLTAGVIDDASKPQRYSKYLEDSTAIRARLGLADDWGTQAGPGPRDRHSEQPNVLEVALVIDTTGSMSDELEYLKVELRAIAEEVRAEFPDVTQRYAMVAYRDQGDAYVTRTAGFATVDGFIDALGEQRAGGGGDFPEAMDQALEQANLLQWTPEPNVARVAFLVADAPPHDDRVQAFADAVQGAKQRGVALYPVAASGAADTAEYLLRTSAHLTGGQYMFLTDHSGVGSPQAKPNVDTFDVETLHGAMHRMIQRELGPAGDRPTPKPAIAVDPPAPAQPIESLPVLAPAEEQDGFWDRLRDALAAHFGFASGLTLAVFASMAIDARRRRRRRRR